MTDPDTEPTPSAPATPAPALPEVVVVGRPNVGKSSLFNRIARRRIAIVHGHSGVTRDRIRTETAWAGRRFTLVDTGGIGLGAGERVDDAMDEAIISQVNTAIGTAAVILFAVDGQAGVTALDEEVAARLRGADRPIIVVANKADNARIETDAEADFSRFGFDAVVPVSALHGRGIHDLLDDVVERLPEAGETARAPEALRLALVGRPNVGKSSMLNRIVEDERTIVSEIPGTTRDSIDVPFTLETPDGPRAAVLIDTAGLRRTGKIPTAVERIGVSRTEDSIRRCDLAVLLLDASTGITRQDKHVASVILRHSRGCVVALNKWDLADPPNQGRWRRQISREVPFLGFAPLVFVSALRGDGIDEMLAAVDYVAGQIDTRLGTGLLNRVLADALDRVQPPMRNGRRLKVYYATQTGTRPITLRLFCNDPRVLSSSYERYLEQRLRRAFGLEGAPIVLRWRRRPRRAPGERRAATPEITELAAAGAFDDDSAELDGSVDPDTSEEWAEPPDPSGSGDTVSPDDRD